MELPQLEILYKKYNTKGFEVLAFDVTSDPKRALQFRDEKELSFTMLNGGKEEAYGAFGITGKPSSFFIDQEGKVVKFKRGFRKGDEVVVEAAIVSLLK